MKLCLTFSFDSTFFGRQCSSTKLLYRRRRQQQQQQPKKKKKTLFNTKYKLLTKQSMQGLG